MIISLTTSFPTFSFRALISPYLTIIISFLTTAEVKETKSLPSITRTLFVREAIICPTTSGQIIQTSCSLNFCSRPILRSTWSTSSSICFVFPSFINKAPNSLFQITCKYNIKSQMRPENQEISPPVTVNNL